jgi:hypothetical protein
MNTHDTNNTSSNATLQSANNNNNNNMSANAQNVESNTAGGNISNVLSHMQKLEESNKQLEALLKEADERIVALSAEKRAGMKSALDTFIKNWVNANEADDTVKHNFFQGVESLAEKADENNGVWKMMVAASNLHARQEHDLDKLRAENLDLKQRVDGMYSTSEARIGDKRTRMDDSGGSMQKSESANADPAGRDGIWADFAASMAQF